LKSCGFDFFHLRKVLSASLEYSIVYIIGYQNNAASLLECGMILSHH
jgi:hypothetical protein